MRKKEKKRKEKAIGERKRIQKSQNLESRFFSIYLSISSITLYSNIGLQLFKLDWKVNSKDYNFVAAQIHTFIWSKSPFQHGPENWMNFTI